MTNTNLTRTEAAAARAGVTEHDYLTAIDAAIDAALTEPDERYVDEGDVETVTEQDRADLAATIAWEEFHGFGA